MIKIVLLLSFILAVSVEPAFAQMKSGSEMQNYNSVFGLSDAPKNYSVTYLGCTSPSNILFPGEQPEFRFQLKNNTNQPLTTDGKIELLPFGTKGTAGEIWLPCVYATGDSKSQPVHIDLPAGGTQELKVSLDVPERMGGYAVLFDLGANGRVFGTSVARTFPPDAANIPYPKLLLDANVGLDGLDRLGVRTVRMEWGFSPGNQAAADHLDQLMKSFASHHITVLLVLEAGESSKQPLEKIGRPFLGDNGVMLMPMGNGDRAWLPEQDAEFQKMVTDTCIKYGWPKGPLTAVSLWNEPWEGNSISGWGSDMIRYRTLYECMGNGVDEARRQGADVLVVGCDSSTNTWDKLFPDGQDTYLKWLDACTIHYQGITAPSLYKKWINRKGPHGRVQIWDTESWVANTDDRVSTIVATDRAAGYDRGMGVFHGNVTTPHSDSAYDAWPVAASVGAVQHFIGEREFKEFLFQKGLPWIFVFNGLNGNVDDGSVVIAGDLGEVQGENAFPFRLVRGLKEMQDKEEIKAKLAALAANSPDRADLQKRLNTPDVLSGGLLTLPAMDHAQAFDFYGNPLPLVDGKIQIPLDFRGYYMRADGSPGSFAKLLEALRSARIDGYEPLNVVAHDALQPLSKGGVFRLTLSNILNRSIQGKLQIEIPGLQMDAPSDLSFAPFETKEIELKSSSAPREDNAYPLHLVFDAGADGKVIHDETLHVNEIARKTITVDGKLEDWSGILPQTVVAKGTGAPTLTEAAWLPFKNFAQNLKAGFASAYMAYDDRYFYFAAKIADDSPDAGTVRFANLDADQFFYPEVSYEIDRNKHLTSQEVALAAPVHALVTSATDASPNNKVWNSGTFAGFGLSIQTPAGKAARLTFYLVGETAMQIVDQQSGKLILDRKIESSSQGAYATVEVKGTVLITLKGSKKNSVTLGGIFLDDALDNKLAGDAHARFVGADSDTKGNWPAKYGKLGHWLAGTAADFSHDDLVDAGPLVEHRWPEGVRHFSYRQGTMLPSGTDPSFDNVQIAFNVLPQEDKITILNPPGTMPDFVPGQDTDYEFALNKVADKFGGGTEIWRLRVPGMPTKNFYAREPKSPKDGPVQGGKLVVKYDGNTRLVEAAIPWSEIPEVKSAADAGKPVKISFRVNDNKGVAMELAEERSVSKLNPHTFHTEWTSHWSNEVEFGFGK